MVKIFEALSEDITMAAGGPMGSPTIENWRRYFTTMEKAKKACQIDYAGLDIKWSRGTNKCSSGDLGHVMYTISLIKVE